MNWMQARIQNGAIINYFQVEEECHNLCIVFYLITFFQVFSRYFSSIFCNFSFISKCQLNDATCVSFSGIFQLLWRFKCVQCTLYVSRIIIRSTGQQNRLFQVPVICHKCYGHFSTFVVASYSNLPLIMPGQCTRKEKKVKIYKTQGKKPILCVCEGKVAVGSQFTCLSCLVRCLCLWKAKFLPNPWKEAAGRYLTRETTTQKAL